MDAAKKANSFEYDSSNNMTKLVDAKGSRFTYTYDGRHNVTSALSAADMKYTFAYNSFGLPTESRLVKVVVSNRNFYIYYYDANDNLVKVDEGDTSEWCRSKSSEFI